MPIMDKGKPKFNISTAFGTFDTWNLGMLGLEIV